MSFPPEPKDGTKLAAYSLRHGWRVWERNDQTASILHDPSGRWFMANDYTHNATWQALVVFSTQLYALMPLDLT